MLLLFLWSNHNCSLQRLCVLLDPEGVQDNSLWLSHQDSCPQWIGCDEMATPGWPQWDSHNELTMVRWPWRDGHDKLFHSVSELILLSQFCFFLISPWFLGGKIGGICSWWFSFPWMGNPGKLSDHWTGWNMTQWLVLPKSNYSSKKGNYRKCAHEDYTNIFFP